MPPRHPAIRRTSILRASVSHAIATVMVDDVDRRVLEQLARGRSQTQVAESLGLTTDAVARRLSRLKQYFHAGTTEDRPKEGTLVVGHISMRRVVTLVFSAIFGAVLTLTPAASVPASSDFPAGGTESRWVTSWATAQHTTGPDLQDQTIRMVIHMTKGGDRVRVRLANTLGEQPMQIGAATVGIRAKEAEVIEGTMRPVTFQGSRTVEIPAGAYVLSDSVKLSTAAQQDLAVSVYLPNPVSPSAHGMALDTSYLTRPNAGDHSGDTGGGSFTEETESYLVVKAVEVHGRVPGTVVVTGGSVTDGHGSRSTGTLGTGPQAPPNSRWSDVLARRFLTESPADEQFAVANAGIGGNTASRNCGASLNLAFRDEYANVEDRYDRDVLGLDGVSHVVIYAGTNDLGFATGCPAEEIIGAFSRLVERAHQQGVDVVIATITPRTSYTVEQNRERSEVNAWLRRGGDCSGVCDGIVDFDSAIAWYANPNSIAPEYDSGDGIHPNAEGYHAMAQQFDLTVF